MNKNNGFLVILDCDLDIKEVDLGSFSSEIISFGRDSANSIVFKSGIVSSIHGYFKAIEGGMMVGDNCSTNGTFINGRMLRSSTSVLSDGDIIRIDTQHPGSGHNLGVLMLYTVRQSAGRWQKFSVMGKNRITIGRSQQCDLCLDNMSISRQHAAITSLNGNLFIEDMHSANGIFINGQRVIARAPIHEKDVIMIANSMLFYTAGMLIYKSDIGGTRVVMNNISRVVTVKGKRRAILQNVSLTVEPNDFIAIIGGSGAGKSTVMNAMSGFEHATSGNVLVNNTDLYKNYQVLKNIIGYVPQQDIIYENITLWKMLEYSAKMRMPEDISPQERTRRIHEVLAMVELTEHKDKFIRSLSGGQKKRASIAVELLADPGLFFLDEPTSGLDPGTEESLMKTLNGLAKRKGKTIVMVTHTTQNLHLCDKILFMGKGGRICFYGSPAECMSFFGVDNLTEIYNKVLTDTDVDTWASKYLNQYGRMASVSGNTQHHTPPVQKKASFFRQFGILAARYMTLIMNDRQRLLMTFLQPIGIALLLALVAADDVFDIYNSTKSILFAVSCAGIWVGLFNSIQEICKERNILKREYMANLRMSAYVSSKFAVQLLLSFVQAIIMIAMFALMVGKPDSGLLFSGSFIEMLITMLLTIFSSSAIGLVVSSVSKNSDKAMTLAPFILIIQLLFSGILFELEGFAEKIAYITVSKWSVSSFGTLANLNSLDMAVPMMEHASEDIYKYTFGNMAASWGVMLGFVILCFVLSIFMLKNVSKDSR